MQLINRIPVLDSGWIELQEVMGNDLAIVAAARIKQNVDNNEEYNNPYFVYSRGKEADIRLINYMMLHAHTSPFEQSRMRFAIHCPLFVRNQIRTHRTATYCQFNEASGRYDEFQPEFYIPANFRTQHATNRQMSGANVNEDLNADLKKVVAEQYKSAYQTYENMLRAGVSKEMARIVLPQATYTTFVMNIDLNNLMHFLTLRNALEAQFETRLYAEHMENFFMQNFPVTYQAWQAKKEYDSRYELIVKNHLPLIYKSMNSEE